MNFDKNIHTFIGCDSSYSDSTIVIFGAPFDGTTSYRPGTRFASAAMRNESYGIETYSPYLDRDLSEIKVFDGGDLDIGYGNPEKPLQKIEEYVSEILADTKLPVMLGGEHLVTLGAMRAVTKRYPDLRIVHFDAHADLRDEYIDEQMSHAAVMRRCWELTGDHRIYQFGIRSGDKPEFAWGRDHVCTHMFNLDGVDKLAAEIGQAPVYFTIDLDVLDPSCFPGTGTPEAGGVSFNELLKAASEVIKLNVVAADIVELSPPYDQSGCSTATACKLLREVLLQL